MINLNESHYIGEGCHRKCFIHPSNPNYCIKISKDGSSNERLREIDYYKRLEKRNISWNYLSRYYGEIVTNLGNGDVYELITDDDAQTSKTLEHYLNTVIPEGTHQALENMATYLLEQKIITTSLVPRNIVLQLANHKVTKAVIIDDIGNTEFIPISTFSAFAARRKVRRKLLRFKKLLKLRQLDVLNSIN